MKTLFSLFFVLVLILSACVSPYPGGDPNDDPVGTKGVLKFEQALYDMYDDINNRDIKITLDDPDLTAATVEITIGSSRLGSEVKTVTMNKVSAGKYIYEATVPDSFGSDSIWDNDVGDLLAPNSLEDITASYQDKNPNLSIIATTQIKLRYVG